MSEHTPGPWFSDSCGLIWRRHPSDLYQNGGGVAGDNPLAIVNKGWFDEGSVGYPVDANARLIAAAPDLLEALKSLCGCISETRGRNADNALHAAKLAIEKATGEKQC